MTGCTATNRPHRRVVSDVRACTSQYVSLKMSHLWGSCPHLIIVSFGPKILQPKQHLDHFGHFSTAHTCDQETHTDHATTMGRAPHVAHIDKAWHREGQREKARRQIDR